MRIEYIRSILSGTVLKKPGDIAEIDDVTGKSLIARGIAKKTKEEAKKPKEPNKTNKDNGPVEPNKDNGD